MFHPALVPGWEDAGRLGGFNELNLDHGQSSPGLASRSWPGGAGEVRSCWWGVGGLVLGWRGAPLQASWEDRQPSDGRVREPLEERLD